MRAVGIWRRASAAVSAPALVRVPFTSRRRLRAAPAASARDAPLVWRRPRNEPPSALVAGMRNRGEVAGGVGGRRRREAAAGREGKGGGWRGAEAASRGELGLAEAAGAGPSASLPPGAPGMSAPGIRGRPLPALGRRTPAPLGLRRSPERLKLGSRDAQPIREGGTGILGRAPEPLFPPSPKSAPAGQAGPLAQEAWVVGRGKASAKWGRQSGIVLPHPIAPRSKDPSTSVASALLPLPMPSKLCLGRGW